MFILIIGAIEEREEAIEKNTGNKEILDEDNLKNTPDDIPEQRTKLTSGAYFSEFPLYYLDYSQYEGLTMENAELWIIGNEIILHTKADDEVDVIAYYSIKRVDKGDYTEISDITLESNKTYGFTNEEWIIKTLKEDYGCEIEKNKPYSLEKWYEWGSVNGYIDFFRDLYLQSLQLNITKVEESESKTYIKGKYSNVEGSTYVDKKIPTDYLEAPAVNTSEIYNGNVYITNLGVVASGDEEKINRVFGFGDIEAYILPKTIMIHSNLSKESEFTYINIVVELSIERKGNSILLFVYL